MNIEKLKDELAVLSDFSAFNEDEQISTVRYSFENDKFLIDGQEICSYEIEEHPDRFNLKFDRVMVEPINYLLIVPNADRKVILNYDELRLKENPLRSPDAEDGFFIF